MRRKVLYLSLRHTKTIEPSSSEPIVFAGKLPLKHVHTLHKFHAIFYAKFILRGVIDHLTTNLHHFLRKKGTFAWTSRTYGPSVLVFGTNGATNFDSYFHFPHAHNIMQILNAEFVRSYLDLSYLSLKPIEINKMQFSIHVYEKMSAHVLFRFRATTVFSCVFLLYTHHATKSSSNMI